MTFFGIDEDTLFWVKSTMRCVKLLCVLCLPNAMLFCSISLKLSPAKAPNLAGLKSLKSVLLQCQNLL
jgi:hypothetical protein